MLKTFTIMCVYGDRRLYANCNGFERVNRRERGGGGRIKRRERYDDRKSRRDATISTHSALC
jgi:hypothetical protein